jgi:acyl carrier protein
MNADSRIRDRASCKPQDVLRDVTQIVADQLGMDTAKIRESDALIEDLGCDSLDIVEISMELEEHFDVAIPDEFADTARTVRDVAEGMMRLLATTAS